MRTFIRIAEVWVPSEDEGLLELAGGLFDSAPAFGAITRRMCFGVGSYFRRAAAARAEGLSCAVACPIFLGDVLTCVVVPTRKTNTDPTSNPAAWTSMRPPAQR